MTIERRSETIPASGQLETAAGTLFRLITASAAVEIRLESRGTSERILNVTAAIIRRVRPFDFVRIIGAAGTTVQFFYGAENVDTDETDVPVSSLTITGTASTAEVPSTTISDLAPVVIATATAPSIVAASVTRRKMRIQADSTNPGSVFLRTAAGGNNIGELQPGVALDVDTFDEIFARNDTGANCTVYRFEQT